MMRDSLSWLEANWERIADRELEAVLRERGANRLQRRLTASV
jgi:hypothetical protein